MDGNAGHMHETPSMNVWRACPVCMHMHMCKYIHTCIIYVYLPILHVWLYVHVYALYVCAYVLYSTCTCTLYVYIYMYTFMVLFILLTCVVVCEDHWLSVLATGRGRGGGGGGGGGGGEGGSVRLLHPKLLLTSLEKVGSAAMVFPPSMDPYMTAASCSRHNRPATRGNTVTYIHAHVHRSSASDITQNQCHIPIQLLLYTSYGNWTHWEELHVFCPLFE